MQMNTPPLSPRLSIYRWRLTMLASIAHRASGIYLVLALPLFFWLLLTMAHGQTAFINGSEWLHSGSGKLILWLTATALFYHFVNGLRFLSLDLGCGESRELMKLSAKLVLGSTLLVAVLVGVLL